jgi:hypothetical protein
MNLAAGYTLFWQVGWLQEQAISTSSDPASRHESLQYFCPEATVQLHGSWAQVLASFSAMVIFPC